MATIPYTMGLLRCGRTSVARVMGVLPQLKNPMAYGTVTTNELTQESLSKEKRGHEQRAKSKPSLLESKFLLFQVPKTPLFIVRLCVFPFFYYEEFHNEALL